MTPGTYDDFPARLVEAATLQLGDEQLADRYKWEWLASLPVRSRYRRWRYALSLFLHGARATRWETRRQPSDSNWSSPSAILRSLVCLLAILPAAGYLLTFGSALIQSSATTDNIVWWLIVGALASLIFSYRSARWAFLAGAVISLAETWTGTAYLQGGGPFDINLIAPPQIIPYPAVQAICLGVLVGATTAAVRYRLAWIIRAFAGLGVCALAWDSCVNASLSGALSDPTLDSTLGLVYRSFWGLPERGPVECVGIWNSYGVCVPSVDLYMPSLSSNGLVVAGNFLGMVAFGLQIFILARLAALILRFLRITIQLLGVSGFWRGRKQGAS